MRAWAESKAIGLVYSYTFARDVIQERSRREIEQKVGAKEGREEERWKVEASHDPDFSDSTVCNSILSFIASTQSH